MAGGVRHDEIFTLMHVLEEFRKLDPDLPIQYALSFLTLAQNEGMSMRELAERLGIAQSSASRNVAALSKWHSFGKPGLDLVQAEEDPRERRRKIISLTPKGHELIATLREMMDREPRRAKTRLTTGQGWAMMGSGIGKPASAPVSTDPAMNNPIIPLPRLYLRRAHHRGADGGSCSCRVPFARRRKRACAVSRLPSATMTAAPGRTRRHGSASSGGHCRLLALKCFPVRRATRNSRWRALRRRRRPPA